MLYPTEIAYLSSLKEHLQKRRFNIAINYSKDLVHLGLTVSKGDNYFQLRLKRTGRIFKHYDITLFCSSIESLSILEHTNKKCRHETGFFNFGKKTFHDRVSTVVDYLKSNFSHIQKKAADEKTLNQKAEELKAMLQYTEKLSSYNCIHPTIGIEFNGNEIHPVFGIGVGNDFVGGLLLYDPFENQLESGSYMGFGDLEHLGSTGVYDSIEFGVEYSDSVETVSDGYNNFPG